ncbi:MAG: hypothetical protein S4CHLAM123_09390 [Chlamydiales bacterium]|nr:hypothetical protein [Chlamydiales bacterium]
MGEYELLHLLKKKKSFFEAMLELTEDEAELPIPEWISALEQKKILLSCIDEIDSEMHPFKSNLHDISQEISEELDNIRKVVKQILYIDAINQEKRKRELRPENGLEA